MTSPISTNHYSSNCSIEDIALHERGSLDQFKAHQKRVKIYLSVAALIAGIAVVSFAAGNSAIVSGVCLIAGGITLSKGCHLMHDAFIAYTMELAQMGFKGRCVANFSKVRLIAPTDPLFARDPARLGLEWPYLMDIF